MEASAFPTTQVFLVPRLSQIAELPLCKLQGLSKEAGAGKPSLPSLQPAEGGGSQPREETLLFVLGGGGWVLAAAPYQPSSLWLSSPPTGAGHCEDNE